MRNGLIVRAALAALAVLVPVFNTARLSAEEGGHGMMRPRPAIGSTAGQTPQTPPTGTTQTSSTSTTAKTGTATTPNRTGEGGAAATGEGASASTTGSDVSAQFPVTAYNLKTTGNRPQAICVGPDGNFWVTEVLHQQIVKVTPKGEVTEYPVTPAEGGPKVGVLQGIAAGPDGNLWFTSREENAIRQISTDGKLLKSFTIPSGKDGYMPGAPNKSAWPREIAPGPDGSLWFAEMAVNKIGHIEKDGTIKEFDLPTPNTQPYRVTLGPDKMIWYSGWGISKVGKLDPATGKCTEYAAPSGCRELCVGPDNNIWYTGDKGNKVGRMTLDGKTTEFAVPTPNAGLVGICAGADKAVWFCEIRGGKIGRVTMDGKVTEVTMPGTNPQPFTLTEGPDKNIWVALQANAIVKITVAAAK